jgi:PAS domain S-box-containing protein
LRYRLLWESCPDAVILMDSEGRIHFANPAVQSVFGYSPDELVGQNLQLLRPDDCGPCTDGVAAYLNSISRGQNWRAIETVGRRKDGAEIRSKRALVPWN